MYNSSPSLDQIFAHLDTVMQLALGDDQHQQVWQPLAIHMQGGIEESVCRGGASMNRWLDGAAQHYPIEPATTDLPTLQSVRAERAVLHAIRQHLAQGDALQALLRPECRPLDPAFIERLSAKLTRARELLQSVSWCWGPMEDAANRSVQNTLLHAVDQLALIQSQLLEIEDDAEEELAG